MASVALYDLLKLEESSAREITGGIDIAIAVKNGGGLYGSLTDSIPAHENLIARAATLYYERAGMNGRAVFSVEKNIPAGAGLGGGSSDAAAALKLLNGRFGRFREDELADLGSKIGADVPYCLHGGFAIGRGIGELITPVPGKLPPWVLIINDAIHVDTGAAYRSLNRDTGADAGREAAAGRTIRRLAGALSKGSLEELKEAAVNDFETPVFRRYPRIRHIKEELYGSGAAFAIMTGSGSSVIGLFQQKESAERARSKLAGACREVLLTQFVQ